VSGGFLLGEHYRAVLQTPPAVSQSVAADSFAQSLLRINSSIPPRDNVLVFWRNPDPDFFYVFFWATYWLYPRKVSVTTSFGPGVSASAETLVYVRRPNEPAVFLPGFAAKAVIEYPDLIVTTYRHGDG